MTSSTEVMSSGSVHDYEGSEASLLSKSPHRHKRRSPKSNKNDLPEEVQDDIDILMDSVPDLYSTFKVVDKIGSGTFSSVYLAQLKNYPRITTQFALKHIIPTSHPTRIENELRCLQELGGTDNVMGVEACLRHRDHVVIVMPYFAHDYFPDYIKKVTPSDVRNYMKALLIALRRVHAEDIIHRDVKPTNFLVNTKLKKYALVDFGLAQRAPVPLRLGKSNRCRLALAEVPSGSHLPPITPVSKPTKSPRKQQHQEPVRTSPRKRKADNTENFPESPRKRMAGRDAETTLAELDLNASNKKTAVETKDTHLKQARTSLTPTPADEALSVDHNKNKSPRRALLTKRALTMGQDQVKPQSRTLHVNHQRTGSKPGGQNRTLHIGQGGKVVGPAARQPVVVQQAGRPMYKTLPPTACQCFSQAQICNICVSRSPQVAPRAGTPGFRAPEVLMKYPEQTTAVDIWSAGVIFLSLLSGRYPFFKADDDMTALAQITTILGTETMKKASRAYGKELTCNPTLPNLTLRTLCEKLRDTSRCTSRSPSDRAWRSVPDSAYELLQAMLNPNPYERITAEEALTHEFLQSS